MTNIGRFRLGDRVPIELVPSAPLSPLTVPLVNVVDQFSNPVASLSLYSDDWITFQGTLLLDQRFSPGTFTVSWSTPAGLLSEQFTVTPGGDAGSDVIALYSHEGPGGRSILAQLRSGMLVQGDRPHV